MFAWAFDIHFIYPNAEDWKIECIQTNASNKSIVLDTMSWGKPKGKIAL